MKAADVIQHFGRSKQATASALGITRSAVAQWDDIVPEQVAWKVQILTGGVLRVDPAIYEARRAEIARKRIENRGRRSAA